MLERVRNGQRCFLLAVLVAALVSASIEIPVGAASAEGAAGTGITTVDGTLTVLASDAMPGSRAGAAATQYTLTSSEGVAYVLMPRRTVSYRTGQRLRATGRLSHQGLTPVLVDVTVQPLLSPMLQAAPGTTGDQSILVILAQWTAPDSVTPESAQAMIGTTDANFYRAASYGKLRLSATTTPWLSIPTSSCTDTTAIAARAKTAAVTAGFDPATYDRVMIYFPDDHRCQDWSGRGVVGGTTSWINGWMTPGVTQHELGHNLGLEHAGRLDCWSGQPPRMPMGDSCTILEYGDGYDPMGDSYAPNDFNAFEKDQLGWLDGPVLEPTATGSATLAPVTTDSADTQLIIAHGPMHTYYIEYRQQTGLDATLPTVGTGVLVRTDFEPPGQPLVGASLMFMNGDSFPMAPNSSYTTPDRVTISTGSYSPGGARVSVRIDPDGVAGTYPAAGQTADGANNAYSIYFRYSMAGASLNGAFRLTRQGSSVAVPGAGSYQDVAPDEHMFSFRPTAPLLPGAVYTATLSTGATGTDGGHPSQPYSWSFTTSGADPILARFQAVGGSALLGRAQGAGYPISGGWAQDYDHGRAYWTAATGAHVLSGPVLDKYTSLGGPTTLGFPTTDTRQTADGTGSYASFAKTVSIYWTAATGAHEVGGGIRDRWIALGAERGVLGYPTTDEKATPDGVGRYNHFSKSASIYWTRSSGAHEVGGGIRDKWAATGWERGPLGYPTTDEKGAPDGVGRYNHFTKSASIYWTRATGAHTVTGAIRTRWASLGWEKSRYGYPTSDAYVVSGGTRQDFQHGRLTLSGGAVR